MKLFCILHVYTHPGILYVDSAYIQRHTDIKYFKYDVELSNVAFNEKHDMVKKNYGSLQA